MSYGPGWKLFKQRQREIAEAKKARRVGSKIPSRAGEATTACDPALPAGGAMDPLPAPPREQRQAVGRGGAHSSDAGGNRTKPGAPAEQVEALHPDMLPIAELTDAIRALTVLVAERPAAVAAPAIEPAPDGVGERLVRVETSLVEFAAKVAEFRAQLSAAERNAAAVARRIAALEQADLAAEPAPAVDLAPLMDRLGALEKALEARAQTAVAGDELRKLKALIGSFDTRIAAVESLGKSLQERAEKLAAAPAAVALSRIEGLETTVAKLSGQLSAFLNDRRFAARPPSFTPPARARL